MISRFTNNRGSTTLRQSVSPLDERPSIDESYSLGNPSSRQDAITLRKWFVSMLSEIENVGDDLERVELAQIVHFLAL